MRTRLHSRAPVMRARAPALASGPASRREARLPAPTQSLDTRLRRAHLLGHRVPVAVREQGGRGVQRVMWFRDCSGQVYDADSLGLTDLYYKLWEWKVERNSPPEERWTRLPDLEIANRISQLELQIEVTKKRIGKPLDQAKLGKEFVKKHLIAGNALNPTTLQQSIQKSIDYDRALNTVLHVTPEELEGIQRLFLRSLSAMSPFEDRSSAGAIPLLLRR